MSQSERFKEVARELGTDDDPERFKAVLRKIASAPVKEPELKPKRAKAE